MKRAAADIFKDALALPAEARAELARRMRESLDAGVEVHRKKFEQGRRRALNRLRSSPFIASMNLRSVPT